MNGSSGAWDIIDEVCHRIEAAVPCLEFAYAAMAALGRQRDQLLGIARIRTAIS